MKSQLREELANYKTTLDELLESASKHDAAFDALDEKLNQVRDLAERGIDPMDDRLAGKKIMASNQLSLLAKRRDELSDSLGESFQALKNHLGNAQHVIAQASSDQLQAIVNEIAKALEPFCDNLETAQRIAKETSLYRACLGRVSRHHGSVSDPRAAGREVAEQIDLLLTGKNFFACCRKQKAQA